MVSTTQYNIHLDDKHCIYICNHMQIICISHITSYKLSWFCSPSQSSQLRSRSDSEWFRSSLKSDIVSWKNWLQVKGWQQASFQVSEVNGLAPEGFHHGDTRYSLDQSWPIPISSQCCAKVSGLETYVKSLWIRVNLVCKVAILVTVWYWHESIYLQCGQTRWVGTTFHTHFLYAWLRCFRTETILALYVILFLSLEESQQGARPGISVRRNCNVLYESTAGTCEKPFESVIWPSRNKWVLYPKVSQVPN